MGTKSTSLSDSLEFMVNGATLVSLSGDTDSCVLPIMDLVPHRDFIFSVYITSCCKLCSILYLERNKPAVY